MSRRHNGTFKCSRHLYPNFPFPPPVPSPRNDVIVPRPPRLITAPRLCRPPPPRPFLTAQCIPDTAQAQSRSITATPPHARVTRRRPTTSALAVQDPHQGQGTRHPLRPPLPQPRRHRVISTRQFCALPPTALLNPVARLLPLPRQRRRFILPPMLPSTQSRPRGKGEAPFEPYTDGIVPFPDQHVYVFLASLAASLLTTPQRF